MIRSVPYAARRIRQTLTGFDNGMSLLAGMGRHRVTGHPDELVFRLGGGTQVICPNVPGARLPIYEVLLEDTYRLSWFTRDLDDSAVAVDVGAHIGNFSLAFLQRHRNGHVHAYEPSPLTAEYLRRNVAANSLDERVHCHQSAVAAETGTVNFSDNGAGSVHNGLTSPEATRPMTVPAVSLAHAIVAAGGQVDLLKLDCEGAEYDMILRTEPEALADVRRVVMEYHDLPGHSWEMLEERFAEAGLYVQRRDPVTARLGLAWLAREAVE